MKAFVTKHKERVALVGVGVAFLLLVGVGIYLQKMNRQERETTQIEEVPERVEVAVTTIQSGGGGTGISGEDGDGAVTSSSSQSFFLKPSPDELLKQLEQMENLNKKVIEKKLIQMRVLWPVFFFGLQDTVPKSENIKIIFDVSEDGFGVVVESEVNPLHYPELEITERGAKVWLGGKILAVDPEGTGTIYLDIEHLSVGEELPKIQAQQEVTMDPVSN